MTKTPDLSKLTGKRLIQPPALPPFRDDLSAVIEWHRNEIKVVRNGALWHTHRRHPFVCYVRRVHKSIKRRMLQGER